MKFAFSNVACPKWDFETLIARAREYGYDGIEVRGFLNESILTAANVFLTDPLKVRDLFAAGGVQIACLASSVGMAGKWKEKKQAANDLLRYIDTAQALECPLVKIFDAQIKAGHNRNDAAGEYAAWLAPMADYAAERNVTIVIENALSFRTAKEIWPILEVLNHPAIGVCWDVFNAAVIGESPAASVPVLNNRILYTQVKDAILGPLGASFCKLGEGNVRVADFLRRLKGIGYTGWVTFEWEKAWLPNLAEPEEILPDAIQKLREWTKPQIEEGAEGKKKPEKKPAPAKPVAAAT